MLSSDEVKFLPVTAELVDTFWPHVISLLLPAIETAEGKTSPEQINTDCKSGKAMLWVVVCGNDIIAALVTRVYRYSGKQGFAIEFVGGKQMKQWIDLVLNTLERVAKESGCTHFEAYGRRAWQRWLERRNFKPKFIQYEMEIK
jgi:citrate lyase beta subunit|tara:strand:- start:651 stop:1082 length:432 start_codon:yes stop_codon:yes gene_type:complete